MINNLIQSIIKKKKILTAKIKIKMKTLLMPRIIK